MNGKGMALLAIAVVAIGTFALPNTVSLFSGQHTWYDLSPEGNDVPCEKCHADIAEEMDAFEGPHTGETGYGKFKCEYCHRVFPIHDKNSSFENYTYASGDGTGAEPGVEAHAASTVACMYCHSGGSYFEGLYGNWYRGYDRTFIHVDKERTCLGMGCHPQYPPAHDTDEYFSSDALPNYGDCRKCHGNAHEPLDNNWVYYVPPAGGFNLTLYPYDTGSNAAHKTFVMDAIDDPLMEDANEACIACHTHTAVKITWTHAYSLEFNVSFEDGLYPPTHFNVSDFTANGTANVTVYGNGTGGGSTSGWP